MVLTVFPIQNRLRTNLFNRVHMTKLRPQMKEVYRLKVVTIVSLFIGFIIDIMRLILEFLKCEYLGMRTFKHSHNPSETSEF